MSNLALAIRTAREARQLWAEAYRMHSNPVGKADRMRAADMLWAKVLWLTGRIGGEAYSEILSGK
jgi:hypothetical protein